MIIITIIIIMMMIVIIVIIIIIKIKRLEKWFCTFFNSPPCAESKSSSTFILGLKLADL